jgi:hypothetical protein
MGRVGEAVDSQKDYHPGAVRMNPTVEEGWNHEEDSAAEADEVE